MRQSIPPELEDAILTAMEKAPADRFKTAGEFEEALDLLDSGAVPLRRASRTMSSPTLQRRGARKSRRSVWIAASAAVAVGLAAAGWQFFLRGGGAAEGAGGLDPKTVAVLYFEDLSPAEDLGYVSDGLTEELIGRLSIVQSLEVVSRNGVAQFRDSDASRDSIARALEAGTLIEGSIMPAGDRLRITMFLVDGASGADFERASFEIPASEFLAMQDSVTEEISGLLRERLGEEIELRERRAATSSVEAWAMVQQAERLRKDGEALLEADDVDGAFSSFDRADSILALAETTDAEWAEPIVLRSRIAYRRSRLASDMPEAERWIEAGMGHANRALAMDHDNAEALELRGTLQYWGWIIGTEPDPDAAEDLLNAARADLEAAVNADASLAGAYSTLSHLYYQIDDDVPGALRAAQRAYQEDAYLAVANQVLWRLFLGSFDLELLTQARRWCSEGYRRFPNDYRFTECQLWVMTTPLVEPDVDEAWRLNRQMVELTPEPDREHQQHRGEMILGGVLARAEMPDSARQVLTGARAGFELDPDQNLVFIEAYMRTLLGDYDESVQLLERFTAGAANPTDVLAADYWWWRDLQDHPGFRRLVDTAN
jgi:serine/threonine-protein kinase